jgi:hypothetical protein
MPWDRRDFIWGEPAGKGNWEKSFRPLLAPEAGREAAEEEWAFRAGVSLVSFVKPGRFPEFRKRPDPLPASGAGIV